MDNNLHLSGSLFKKGLLMFCAIIGISFWAGTVQASSTDPWYDSSWSHRKQISVSGNGSALTDYPLKFTVTYASGKMNADFSDLRFVSTDGATLYDYYIESKTDSVSAAVSVKIDSLPANGTLLYMYYGNSGAGSLSSGDDTFPIFDHFDDASIGAEWTVVNPDGNQTIAESGTSVAMTTDVGISNLDISTGNQDAPRIIQSMSGNFAIETKITTTNASYDLTGILLWKDAQNFYVFGKGMMSGSERIWRRKNIADVITDTAYGSTAYTPDTVYLRMVRNGTTVTCYYSSDNATWTQAFSETFGSADPLSVGFVRFDTTNRTYSGSVDWFLARGYTASEPTAVWNIEEVQDPASLTDWSYRKAITIDHTQVSGGANLINFPVLVNLASDAGLAAHAQADGKDIIFALSSGAGWGTANDRLAHEIEYYDGETGELVAWVRLPELSASADTAIYMYYGNSSITTSQENKTNVWDGNFKLVQHMSQDPSTSAPQMVDSTSFGNNGTSSGTMLSEDRIEGKMGRAVDFDGTDDYIDCGNAASVNTSRMTLSAYVKFHSFPTSSTYFIQKTGRWGFVYRDGKFRLQIWNGSTIISATTPSLNVWYSLVGTYDSNNNLRLYVNGAEEGNGNGGSSQSTLGSFAIGYAAAQGDYHDGIIDEVRISSDARSADWIATEYANQSSPSSFLALSSEQSFMDHFTLSGDPSQFSRASQTITLTAIDTFGNTDTLYAGDKAITFSGANPEGSNIPTFTDKDGNAVPFGSSGTLTFASGVATTAITLYKVETASIQASDEVYQLNSPFSIEVRSLGGSFVLPRKPVIDPSSISIGDLSRLPDDIAQIAISRIPDFGGVSWQEFDMEKYVHLNECTEVLYFKFRTSSGAVSDVLIYTPRNLPSLNDGDIVKTSSSFDVYVIKLMNGKYFKRLILSPSVFSSYRHLRWENLKIISQERLDQYQTSSLVQVEGDVNLYEFIPFGDTGKRKVFMGEYDIDSVYEINAVDRDSYKDEA